MDQRLVIGLFLGLCSAAMGQTGPRSLHPNVTVDTYATLSRPGVRLVRDPISQTFFYADTEGNVFQIRGVATGKATEVPVASTAEHGIEYLQGMAFADSVLILVGIRRLPYQSVGRIVKGKLRADGSRRWITLCETAPYPASGTSFDHSFNGVCVSPDRDSIYVNSGSRTDHGEEQNNGGRYPNLRETALTARIFKLPLAGENLTLPNDVESVRQLGLLFCEGVRNTFDMALNGEGRLFGAENAGNRSDPEELNWLRPGRHYGFPWIIGGNETPQQFPDYDPNNDPLLSPGYRSNDFRNDPTYPPRPAGPLTPAIVNSGPDASFAVDPNTRTLVPSPNLTTFTPHASPLGLVFDTDSILADFTGLGFILGYTPGRGLDLSSLRLQYDPAVDNYRVQVTRIADGFNTPADAELVGTALYILERGRKAISRVQFRERIDSSARADVSLSMVTSSRSPSVGETMTFDVTVQNKGPQAARSIRIQNRLPAGLTFGKSDEFQLTPDGLMATLDELPAGTKHRLSYVAQLTQSGVYRNSAQVVAASPADPDSRPNTGTADGEDDMATVDWRSKSIDNLLRESPNPTGVQLPLVQSGQPAPDPTRPDLSLTLAIDKRVSRVDEVITLTFRVQNDGGRVAGDVRLRCRLPGAVRMNEGNGWSTENDTFLSEPFSIAAGSIVTRSVRLRVKELGSYILESTLSGPADADSTPDNGYDNGEDDEARLEIRVVMR